MKLSIDGSPQEASTKGRALVEELVTWLEPRCPDAALIAKALVDNPPEGSTTDPALRSLVHQLDRARSDLMARMVNEILLEILTP